MIKTLTPVKREDASYVGSFFTYEAVVGFLDLLSILYFYVMILEKHNYIFVFTSTAVSCCGIMYYINL